MASAGTPISGTGSSVESIVPEVELNDGAAPAPETQEIEGTESTSTEGQQPTVETQTQIREDGRVIPQALRELKESNPAAYKVAKEAFFENRAWREVFPNIQAARETSDLLKSVGGKEGLTTLRGDAQVFKTAAQQFLKGDPAFTKDLWDEDPIAAALHVAPMLEELKTRDRESYNSTVTRMWDQEFEAVGMTGGLANLKQAIETGTKESLGAALNILKSIMDWKDSITSLAKKAEDPRVKTLLAERASQRDNQSKTEHQEFLKSYRTDTLNDLATAAGTVFDSFFKGKLDPDDRRDLLADAIKLADREVVKDPKFIEQREAHLANGDSHSARQLTLARYKQFMPDAVKRVARRYGYVSGKTQTQQTTTTQQTQQTRTEPGWTLVKERPAPESVDRNRTTNDMILSGKAILKDGKKVDWSALKK